MTIVIHLLPAQDWHNLAPDEAVTNASLATDGFIHCTDDPAVMLQVANAFYRDSPDDFVVLHVEVAAVTSDCVWEEPAHIDGSTGPGFASSFPHIYGPIDRTAIRKVQSVARDSSGRFTGYTTLDPLS